MRLWSSPANAPRQARAVTVRRGALGVVPDVVSGVLLGALLWLHAAQGPQLATALAQSAPPDSVIRLQPSPMLQPGFGPGERAQRPTFLFGDRVSGRPNLDTVVEGNAEMRRADMVIRADRIEYWQPDDLARARGNVRINRSGNLFEGPLLELKVDAFEGFFVTPSYRFLRNDAYGTADRVDFIDDKRAVIRNATYTTCQRQPGPSWMPDWILRAGSVRIDEEDESGEARDAVLSFKGVPVLPLPSLSFPLSDKRRSGFLPPTFGLDSTSGFEYAQPYYWNIAPNRDATFTGTVLTRRGIDVAGEFRYLERDYGGKATASVMPSDRLRNSDRWSYSVQHAGLLAPSLAGAGPLFVGLNLNRVSDDNFWRDFPRAGPALTQRLLPADATATWALGDLSLTARSLRWQTLQDPLAPITPPYDRAPQWIARWTRSALPLGLDVSALADVTRFESATALTGQPNGRRSLAVMALSRPWIADAGFITPRLQWHTTRYDFDQPLADGRLTAQRSLPTFSIDSGLVFERMARYVGRDWVQTLEPRAFYVNTPYRDQALLPNYDSAINDFNLATIYTENAFGGNDRIADNHLLTLGATSRLFDPLTGAQAAYFGVAQRLRFRDQRVTLPGGLAANERLSDLLVAAGLNWDPRWSFEGAVQLNLKTQRSIRTTLATRYTPGKYRTVSAAYRLQRGQSEQLDLGWQWPITMFGAPEPGAGRWYSVGRLNFSLKDRRVVDTVAGVEYDGGCWIGRAVFERIQSTVASANTRILLQLEFNGFTRLGTNALQTLQQQIPRYQVLREQVTEPSRFTRWD
ncbi:MAG: LPS-assembly protein LptD [Burkholderiaceae bacterium]